MIQETPLTQAVLQDDREKVLKLARHKSEVLAENSLGFNALELAHYLGKKELSRLLKPEMPRREEENFELIRYLLFEDYASFQKVLKSCSWVLKVPLLASHIIELGRRYREEHLAGFFADVSIRWIDDSIGFGVFAEQDFEKGTYIGEYVGLVRPFKWDTNDYCLNYPSMFWAFRRYMIDAENEGNESRFLNHRWDPNLDLRMAVDRNLIHPLFFTNQDIPKGTELTFNYGKKYWRARERAPL